MVLDNMTTRELVEWIRGLENENQVVALYRDEIEIIASVMTNNILDKTREYHGIKTKESNRFVNELQKEIAEDLKNMIRKFNCHC